MHDLKLEVFKRNKKLKDLADALPIPYQRLSRVINGFDPEPDGFKMKCFRVFTIWDKEKFYVH